MLSGTTPSAAATVGTAVLRIVVSRDSMRKATATIQGRRPLAGGGGVAESMGEPRFTIPARLRRPVDQRRDHAKYFSRSPPRPRGDARGARLLYRMAKAKRERSDRELLWALAL